MIFNSAISSAKPRGVRVIKAYSPQLGRRLQCFGEHAFGQWIRLEADPSVQIFCERLAYLDFAAGKRLMDFWVRRDDWEMLMIGRCRTDRSHHTASRTGRRPQCGCVARTPYRLNAYLLDAPYQCGNCSSLYSAWAPSLVNKLPLSKKERIAITAETESLFMLFSND